MKILKSAIQKNVTVAKHYYSQKELEKMFKSGLIFYINEQYEVANIFKGYDFPTNYNDYNFRIFCEDIDELKVKYLRSSEEYKSVAIIKKDYMVIVEL